MVSLSALSLAFAKRLKRLGLNGHRNFYVLRHTFETIGGESKDQIAVDRIMGHVDTSMAGAYRERISDERLRVVVEHVRGWLFETTGAAVQEQMPAPNSAATARDRQLA
jgi:integrase